MSADQGYCGIVWNHMAHLAKRHLVDLIAFGEEDSAVVGKVSEGAGEIKKVVFRRWPALVRKGMGFLVNRPLQVSYYNSTRMRKAVEASLRTKTYDVVVFFTTAMGQYLPENYRGRSIWYMVDPLMLLNEQYVERGTMVQRMVARDRLRRLRRFERLHARRFDRVVLISRADIRDYQHWLPDAQLTWVSHGIDVDRLRPTPEPSREPFTIVISGQMNYPPNTDAVNFFCREVFPLVIRQTPGARLRLVGNNEAAVRKWSRDRRIEVTGYVRDLGLEIGRAMVSVCAIRFGVGIQNKVLEAMACGTPVVSTSLGNRGVEAVPGRDIEVADTPAGFAEKIVALLKGEGGEMLAANGRRFVEENYTWTKAVQQFESVLEQVLKGE
jgi:glycosyltransferase involved in cell wall biosynthesis